MDPNLKHLNIPKYLLELKYLVNPEFKSSLKNIIKFFLNFRKTSKTNKTHTKQLLMRYVAF